jgi:hypothetical protein
MCAGVTRHSGDGSRQTGLACPDARQSRRTVIVKEMAGPTGEARHCLHYSDPESVGGVPVPQNTSCIETISVAFGAYTHLSIRGAGFTFLGYSSEYSIATSPVIRSV